MEIFLIRHGETNGTERGIRLGSVDNLSKRGIKQSKILAMHLSDIKFDVIFSSPTLRALQTAEIILSLRGEGSIVKLSEISERKEASYFEGMLTNKIPWNYLKKHRLKRNWKYKDGESFSDIFNRSKNILNIFRKYSSKNKILVITHGSIIRALLSIVIFGEKLTPRQYYRLTERIEIHPASVTILKYDQKIFEPKPTWKLNTWMDISHLKKKY